MVLMARPSRPPVVIEPDHMTIDSPEPVNITGHSCDLFVGRHATAGKVALKRLRTAEYSVHNADAVRVSGDVNNVSSHLNSFM